MILVTGGTGFIGGAVVRALVARRERVRTLDNDWRGSRASLSDIAEKIEIVNGDIRDPLVVFEASRGVKSVIHLAAVNGTENFYNRPDLVLEVGVKGIVNVIDAARASGVENLFVMSTSEVYQTAPIVPTDESAPMVVPDPLNPRYSYGSSKIISEMLALHASKIARTCVVRPHNVYGPRMGFEHVIPQFVGRMLPLMKSSGTIRFPIQGTGTETRSFCHIDDFVRGFLVVFDRGENRNIYHVGSEEETSVCTLAEKIARYFGREIEIQTTPLTQGSTPRRCPNIGKIKKLGFKPQISLDEGLQSTIAWYEKNQPPATRSEEHVMAQT
ncbi:MAG: NAD-dependent epimerase/dehydratase family protein [Deltaproteobacteria bacterium]|nr:NAD-dependent epimerase/dehydratase family protein [Deltaproteobacteria bacterium]MBI3296395.1 NAD-dependent epimerase/dehydratase family protein [Deltaproteobacteria bacterium]